MDNITAKSEVELLNHLKIIDIAVPMRIRGRTTENTEKYAIVRFLGTYLNRSKLEFPLSLTHSDKPDFLLLLAGRKIGIECTESIPQQYAWAQALQEEYFPDGVFEPEFFRWDSPERDREEILEILDKSQKESHGNPWFGNSVEKEWAKWMYECIKIKTDKLNSHDFEKFPDNYLLIYDNLPQTKNDLYLSSNLLFGSLESNLDVGNSLLFTKILIESKDRLLVIEQSGFESYDIPKI